MTDTPTAGRLAVVGLGPGNPAWLTPAARAELDQATDLVGYTTYLELAGPFRPEQIVHASDNRAELARARQALHLAAAGRRVALVSSGDPGIFAMATAVMEVLSHDSDPTWQTVELIIVPGISAAQALAARLGAPLGHDFCALSLSDNLKPWSVIARRLRLAAQADLVIALYNPASRARPWQLGAALQVLRRYRTPDTPVGVGHNLGRPGERTEITTLATLRPETIDMRTVLIIGSSQTQRVPRSGGGDWLYTPRVYPAESVSWTRRLWRALSRTVGSSTEG